MLFTLSAVEAAWFEPRHVSWVADGKRMQNGQVEASDPMDRFRLRLGLELEPRALGQVMIKLTEPMA